MPEGQLVEGVPMGAGVTAIVFGVLICCASSAGFLGNDKAKGAKGFVSTFAGVSTFFIAMFATCRNEWSVAGALDASGDVAWGDDDTTLFNAEHASYVWNPSVVMWGPWRVKCESESEAWNELACNPDNMFQYTYPNPPSRAVDVYSAEWSLEDDYGSLRKGLFTKDGGSLPYWNAEAARAQTAVLGLVNSPLMDAARAFACLACLLGPFVLFVSPMVTGWEDDEVGPAAMCIHALATIFFAIPIATWTVVHSELTVAYPGRELSLGWSFVLLCIGLSVNLLSLVLHFSCCDCRGDRGGAPSSGDDLYKSAGSKYSGGTEMATRSGGVTRRV